jgi:hypothetical protein
MWFQTSMHWLFKKEIKQSYGHKNPCAFGTHIEN